MSDWDIQVTILRDGKEFTADVISSGSVSTMIHDVTSELWDWAEREGSKP